VSLDSLERALPGGDRLLLDASTLIAYFDGAEAVSPAAIWVVEAAVKSGRNPAIVSMVTVMELLVRPLRVGARAPYTHVRDFLTQFPYLTLSPIDFAMAQEAASVRASFHLGAADSLTIATGLVHQVGHLVTNDRKWRSRLQPLTGRIGLCYLTDHLPFS
jgi:PIN domain nuclease of toxin-antitoxin system